MLNNLEKNTSKKNLQKILKESINAAKIATKNLEIIETLVSMSEIKAGRYREASSAKDLFKKVGI